MLNSWTCNVKGSTYWSHHCSTVLHPIPQINALFKRSNHLKTNRHISTETISLTGIPWHWYECVHCPTNRYCSYTDDSKSPNTDPYSQFPLNGVYQLINLNEQSCSQNKSCSELSLRYYVIVVIPMSWIGNEPGANISTLFAGALHYW